jgi:hypothetical protein
MLLELPSATELVPVLTVWMGLLRTQTETTATTTTTN